MNKDETLHLSNSSTGASSQIPPGAATASTTMEPTAHADSIDTEMATAAQAAQAESPADVPDVAVLTDANSDLKPLSPAEQALIEQLHALSELFEKKLAFDRFKEKQLEALHAELQEYKRGATESLVLPLIRQIVRYCDQLPRHIQGLKGKPVEQLGPDRIFKELEGVREDLHLILENFGVAIFHKVQDAFDTKTQLAKQTEPTDDPASHGKVLERLLPGFEYNGRMIEKERVKVAVYGGDSGSSAS